jgi:DNA polymerase I-like protein with 3'-5' exonuclease and polymerase domains
MLEFFNSGRDLHTAIAGFLKALDVGWTLTRYLKHMDRWMPGVTEDERFGAKPYNFGLGFGGGPSVVQRTARINYGITLSDDQAQVGYDAYHQFYPDVKPWQNTFWRDVQRGWGETPLGRIRRVSEDDEGPEGVWRKYINLPVQATASDLSLFCMDYTWELLAAEYGKHLHEIVQNIGFFHDAEQLHLKATERDTIEGIVKQAWEHPPLERIGLELPVPLVADITVGKWWKG